MSNFISSLVKSLKRKRPQLRQRTKLGKLESLEGRRLLASDVAAIAGDIDGDGVFGSSDIVSVFQAGKFETDQPASYAEGDWNGDGFFNSGDIVYAFQAAKYEQAEALGADEGDAAAAEGEDTEGDQDRDRRNARERHRDRHQHHRRQHRRHNLEHLMENLAEGIESGDLPGNMTAEEAQGILDGLATAIEGRDVDAIRELVGQVRDAQQLDKLQAKVEKLQEAVNEAVEAGEETVHGLPVGDVQTAIDSASASLADGDADAAAETLKGLRQARAEARRIARVENAIAAVQEDLDEATTAGEETLYGLPVADVQAALTSASDSLAAGELAAAREALAPVIKARRDAARADRAAARIQGAIDRLQAAVDAANEAGEDTIREVAVADIEAAIAAASAALESGDLDAAREALSSLRPEGDRDGRPGRGRGNRGPGRDRGDEEQPEEEDGDGEEVGEAEEGEQRGGRRVPPRRGRPG